MGAVGSTMPPNPGPLLLVVLFVDVIGSQPWCFLILNLFRQDEIQKKRQECSDSEAGFHDENYGVVEPLKSVIVALVRKHIREPAVTPASADGREYRVRGGGRYSLWDENSADADSHARCQDEPISAREWCGGYDADTRNRHSAEQERRHST